MACRPGHRPHIYFLWGEGNPALNYLRYLLFGHGEVAPVTREILRRHESEPGRRPHVHELGPQPLGQQVDRMGK